MYPMNFDNMHREKTSQELHKNATSYIEQILEAILYETTSEQQLTSQVKNHSNKTKKTSGTLLEKQGRTHVTFFNGPLYMVMPVLADELELTYISVRM